MEDIMCLSNLKTGEKAVIKGLSVDGAMRRRLQDLGMIEGTRIECVGISPLGDPSAFLIRGTVIALRKEDADMIQCCV